MLLPVEEALVILFVFTVEFSPILLQLLRYLRIVVPYGLCVLVLAHYDGLAQLLDLDRHDLNVGAQFVDLRTLLIG